MPFGYVKVEFAFPSSWPTKVLRAKATPDRGAVDAIVVPSPFDTVVAIEAAVVIVRVVVVVGIIGAPVASKNDTSGNS